MTETNLYRALYQAHRDAIEQAEYHVKKAQESPLNGWSVEKHLLYHTEHAREAEAAQKYLFYRMMQIDPD